MKAFLLSALIAGVPAALATMLLTARLPTDRKHRLSTGLSSLATFCLLFIFVLWLCERWM